MTSKIHALLITGKQHTTASDAAWSHYWDCIDVLESTSRKEVGFLYEHLSRHVDQLHAMLIG